MEVKELVPNIEISMWLEQYLQAFGIKDTQEYLYPTFKYVESPNIYDGMEDAYNLLINTLDNEGNIGFIQDCDVDGICSCASIYKYLLDLLPEDEQEKLKIYFHSNKKHGITENVVSWVIENNISLLIVPDAGTNDYIQHMDLNFLNVNIIIIDHHKIESKPKYMQEYKSNYKTVIISNQKGWVKNKALSGTGIVAKFLKYIDEKEGLKCSAKYADLVALSLVSDMCDMTSQENRSFFLYGANTINNPFLKYLIDNLIWKKDEEGNSLVNQHTFGFDICPYLNAVCRGTNQQLKKELFYAFIGYIYKEVKTEEFCISTFVPCADTKDYEPLIESLKAEKSYQDKTVDKALEDSQICFVLSCNEVPVLGIMELSNSETYPYTGLIANKLKRQYECNIFVIHESSTDKNNYTGSCRADINTLEMCQQSGLFELASGHEAAHGIIFKKENLEKIKDYFQKECINQEKYKIPVVKTYVFPMESIPKSLFGFGDDWDFLWNNTFVKPVFNIEGININSKDIQILGKGNTIKFKKDGIEFIKFKTTEDEKAELYLKEDKELVINTICNLTVNEWKGRITLQAVIEAMEIDYKICEKEPKKVLTWEDVFG